ncbi:transposase [Streptomyces sp. NPDC059755]|uniref:transposase n=1 Tax=Streptomyces sp. NPDC059755 TaxID=3346934 RepID=UPI003666AF4B
MNGVLYRIRTGVQWRALPERYGPWKTVHERHRRWSGMERGSGCCSGWRSRGRPASTTTG